MNTREDTQRHDATGPTPYRTIFIGEETVANRTLMNTLAESGCTTLLQSEVKISLGDFKEHSPDLAIIAMAAPCAMFLKSLEELQKVSLCAVVMFTEDDSCETIHLATRSGVHAYLTEIPKTPRIRSVIDAAVARYKTTHALRVELEASKTSLNERKIVERAKGILMQRKSLDEPSAYRAMQKLAMDRNVRLVELAQSMISAAEILE